MEIQIVLLFKKSVLYLKFLGEQSLQDIFFFDA